MAEARQPLLYVGGGIVLADACEELRAFVDHLGIPVAHSLMGKGALPDDHPLLLGMSGFWGTKLVNDTCLAADWVLGLGTRFKEADCSSWYRNFTFNIPPTRLIHIDIEPAEIGRNFSTELGAVADLKQALSVLMQVAREMYPAGRKPGHDRQQRSPMPAAASRSSNQAMATSDAFPLMPERILAEVRAQLPRDAIITTDVGWNKNGVGQQFPVYTPGSRADTRRIRDHGLRSAGGHRREDRAARPSRALTGRRRRIRPEPFRARHRGRNTASRSSGWS